MKCKSPISATFAQVQYLGDRLRKKSTAAALTPDASDYDGKCFTLFFREKTQQSTPKTRTPRPGGVADDRANQTTHETGDDDDKGGGDGRPNQVRSPTPVHSPCHAR